MRAKGNFYEKGTWLEAMNGNKFPNSVSRSQSQFSVLLHRTTLPGLLNTVCMNRVKKHPIDKIFQVDIKLFYLPYNHWVDQVYFSILKLASFLGNHIPPVECWASPGPWWCSWRLARSGWARHLSTGSRTWPGSQRAVGPPHLRGQDVHICLLQCTIQMFTNQTVTKQPWENVASTERNKKWFKLSQRNIKMKIIFAPIPHLHLHFLFCSQFYLYRQNIVEDRTSLTQILLIKHFKFK